MAVVTSTSDFVDARGQCGIPEMEFWFPPTSMSSTSTTPTTLNPSNLLRAIQGGTYSVITVGTYGSGRERRWQGYG